MGQNWLQIAETMVLGVKIQQAQNLPKNISFLGKNRHAEGRTRTGTLDNQRGILSPLRLFKPK